MRYLVCAFFVLALAVTVGCGSGGGGSGGGGSTVPPGPGPGPVVVKEAFSGAVDDHVGHFAAETNNSVEYTPSTDVLVISTVHLGTFTVGPSRRYVAGGIEYVVTFDRAALRLIVGELMSPSHYATWDLTLIASPG